MKTVPFIEHYGVKGMKWGVRKKDKEPSARQQRYDQILNAKSRTYQFTAKNGKTLDVVEDKNTKLDALFFSLSKKGIEKNAKLRDDNPSFKFHVDGKHVGEASFRKVSNDEINLVWLGIKRSERGNGYASAVFDAAVKYGQQTGVKKLTLEVPGKSPDARHIYEKQGFKVTKEAQDDDDSVWGGLTEMELDLRSSRLNHAEDEDDEMERALLATFPELDDDQEKTVFGELSHADLSHYGIKGMKWGVRRTDAQLAKAAAKSEPTPVSVSTTPGKKVKAKGGTNQPASEDAVRVAGLKQRAAASSSDSLSTKELQELVSRMNLEQQYDRLKPDTRSAGKVFLDKYLDAEMNAVKKGKEGPTAKTLDMVEKMLNK